MIVADKTTAMAVVYFLVNTGLVSLILGLSQRRRPWCIWRVNFAWSALYLVALAPLARVATVHWPAL